MVVYNSYLSPRRARVHPGVGDLGGVHFNRSSFAPLHDDDAHQEDGRRDRAQRCQHLHRRDTWLLGQRRERKLSCLAVADARSTVLCTLQVKSKLSSTSTFLAWKTAAE